jgi:hypothetical protein
VQVIVDDRAFDQRAIAMHGREGTVMSSASAVSLKEEGS